MHYISQLQYLNKSLQDSVTESNQRLQSRFVRLSSNSILYNLQSAVRIYTFLCN